MGHVLRISPVCDGFHGWRYDDFGGDSEPRTFAGADQGVELLGIRLKRIKCAAMEGLVEEGKEVIDSVEAGPLRDAALIGGGNKVEHYEIASYGTIIALAKQLGYKDAVPLLVETLAEEKAADEKLTMLAEQLSKQKQAEKAA
jgi:ferritin-like metal-binding protein YciE